jgi:hypothetical protein
MKQKRLTEEEYKGWWPFERLDPKRFPETTEKKTAYPTDAEEAPI